MGLSYWVRLRVGVDSTWREVDSGFQDFVGHYWIFIVLVGSWNVRLGFGFLFNLCLYVNFLLLFATSLFVNTGPSDPCKPPFEHIWNVLGACKLCWEALKAIDCQHEVVFSCLLPLGVEAKALGQHARVLCLDFNIKQSSTDLKDSALIRFQQ